MFLQTFHLESNKERFQEQIGILETELTNLKKNVTRLQQDKKNLEDVFTSVEKQVMMLPNITIELQNENMEITKEIEDLQEQIDKETKLISDGIPKIITRLGTSDIRSSPAPGHPWSEVIRFYLAGEVWNVGTGPAINCKLHVTLYQGEIIANETHIELGTIASGYYKDVSINIYYDGPAITNWIINPEFS